MYSLLMSRLVKTLAIRSTAEEAMIARRIYLRSNDKIPSMTTESGMRQYLQVICNHFSHFLSYNVKVASSLFERVYLDGCDQHGPTTR